MTLARTLEPETLDFLDPSDPAAQRSRRDLRRVHRLMGTRRVLVRALRAWVPRPPGSTPLRILELGAGDGTLLLGVAQDLKRDWGAVDLTLLDRQALLQPETVATYAGLGWRARSQLADVLDWAGSDDAASPRWDLIVANLFLHHFDGAELDRLLAAAARCGDRFLACEPRRSWLALVASHLVGCVGANAVTRRDAVLSVHAGFRADELSARWPAAAWDLKEAGAGLFSHVFRAARGGAAAAPKVGA